MVDTDGATKLMLEEEEPSAGVELYMLVTRGLGIPLLGAKYDDEEDLARRDGAPAGMFSLDTSPFCPSCVASGGNKRDGVTDTTLDGRLGLVTPSEYPVRTLSLGDEGSDARVSALAETDARDAELTERPYFCLTVLEAETPEGSEGCCSPDARTEATAA